MVDIVNLGRNLCPRHDTPWNLECNKCPPILRKTYPDPAAADNGNSHKCCWRVFTEDNRYRTGTTTFNLDYYTQMPNCSTILSSYDHHACTSHSNVTLRPGLVPSCITHDLLSMNLNVPFKHHGLKDSELALLGKGIEVMFF